MALGKKDNKVEFYSQEDASRDSTVNLSTLSLFSGNEGSLTCCPLIKMLRGRQDERRTAAQAAAVSSFLNRTFGKPLHATDVRAASSLDGSIYSTAEDQPGSTDQEGKRLFDNFIIFPKPQFINTNQDESFSHFTLIFSVLDFNFD